MQHRVLIVDSDISFVVKVKQALQAGGNYDVTVFATGQAALEHLSRELQDVVIVDFALRDMDGPGLIEKMRSLQPDLAVIAIPSDIYRLPGWLKVDASLEKPYRARDLDPLLQDVIARKAGAPAGPTKTLAHDKDEALDDYMTLTKSISVEDLAAQQIEEVRRQAEALPKDALSDVAAPGVDMSLEDLLETLAMTESPQPTSDDFPSLARRLGREEWVLPQDDQRAGGAPGDLSAPDAALAPEAGAAETPDAELSDDWLLTLVESGPSLPDEKPATPPQPPASPGAPLRTKVLSKDELDAPPAAPPTVTSDELYQTMLLSEAARTPAPPEPAAGARDLDSYLTLTEAIPVESLGGRRIDQARQQAEEPPPEPLSEPDAPGVSAVRDAASGEPVGDEPPVEAAAIPVEHVSTDESFEDILALIEGREEAAEAVETPPADAVSEPQARPRKRGDTEPLPPLEETEAEQAEADEESALYLESFQETIAEIAARPAPFADESAKPLPTTGMLAEWERELEGLANPPEFAFTPEAAPAEAAETASAEDETSFETALTGEDEALWLSIIGVQNEPAPEEELAAMDLSGVLAGTTAESTLSLDDLLNQIEQQIAEATPERRPRLKKLPPRKAKSRRHRKERRLKREQPEATHSREPARPFSRQATIPKPQAEPVAPGDLTATPPQAQPEREPEWEPVGEAGIQPGELPDWLADEVPEDLRGSAVFSAFAEESSSAAPAAPSEAVPETAIEPPPEPELAAVASVATPALPPEPVIVEPTLQSGTAYRGRSFLLADEAPPPPLPPRAPDEWRPAFPGGPARAEPGDEVKPDALFVYPGRQALRPAELSEWQVVAPAEPAAEAPPEPETVAAALEAPEAEPPKTATPEPATPEGVEPAVAAMEPAAREIAAEPAMPVAMGADVAPPAPPPDAPEAEALTARTESARVALQLTHLAVESAAEVLLLTRGLRLMGYAGKVRDREAHQLAEEVYTHWVPGGERRQTQVRFVRLESAAKDYILYSVATVDDMVLSMAFPANTPLGQVRRHAREIARALEADEGAPATRAPTLSEAAPTPSETAGGAAESAAADDLRPAWARAQDSLAPEAPAAASEATAEAAPAASITGAKTEEPQPMTSYTCVWTLRDSRTHLDAEQEESLKAWLNEVAGAYRWRIQAADIRPEYINLEVEAPSADSPSRVVEALMDATSNRMLEAYAGRLVARPGQGLWADGYYVVTPSRRLTEREIARFISYQRREQSAASA